MAIFKSKKNTDEVVKAKRVTKKLPVALTKAEVVLSNNLVKVETSGVIIRPRVTEKASILSSLGRNVAVFEVSKKANKKTVAQAVQAIYKVSPVKVAIIKIPAKSGYVRGRMSEGKVGRKAYVYLKEGDKIETV